jgi:ParB family chromosome partitioning protein
MADNNFKLKSFNDIFAPTDPANKAKSDPVLALPLDKLQPFKSHPFRLYEGQRFEDMVESVKANGVIVPVIVRPISKDDNYEILSGHNRVSAARAAGLETVPALVREDLTDDEALLIVTETNLLQRSFADLTHSERAVTLAMHHDAIKKQGKRTDLIEEIENMVNASNCGDLETSAPVGQKLTSRDKIAQDYCMAKNTVARYLRVNKLIAAHKKRLDEGELAIRAAVTLSYLSEGEQHAVDDVLDSSHYKVDMKKADALRSASEKRPLDHETVEQILAGPRKPRAAKHPAFKLKHKIVSKYFKPEQKPDEIEATIIEALEFFYAHQRGGTADNGDESIPVNVTA